MKFDVLLKGGRVIDPYNEIDAMHDVAVKDGKIAAVAPDLKEEDAATVYDLAGLMVTPGLVDSHVHCYYTGGTPGSWAGDESLQPDIFSFPAGVTTVVEAGSAGSMNFSHFRATVIERSKTRIFAFLNAADYGMTGLQMEQFPDKDDTNAFARCERENRDIIKGIKIAHYWGKDWKQVESAKRAQQKTGLPIMVDFGIFYPERPYDKLVMEKLDPGDITTHCFRPPVPIVDENGRLYDYLRRAQERGIWFDLGHGCASFVLRSAVPAMRQGFLPDTFSSDLHSLSVNSTVINMPSLLSKMLVCCDMPMLELFRRVTSNPVKMLHLGAVGNLCVGTEADIAVWSMRKGTFRFRDASGGSIHGDKRIDCEMTFRAGEIVWDVNARSARPYEQLPKWYGIDLPDERVIPKA